LLQINFLNELSQEATAQPIKLSGFKNRTNQRKVLSASTECLQEGICTFFTNLLQQDTTGAQNSGSAVRIKYTWHSGSLSYTSNVSCNFYLCDFLWMNLNKSWL
jgi:hypothetical protein